jgi:hypothetical protein
VRFLGGGQVRFQFLDIGVQLSHGSFVIIQTVQLVLAIEFGHDVAFLYVATGLGYFQQHQREIGTSSASATSARVSTAPSLSRAARSYQPG